MDRADLGFVGDIEERLEDASSNEGKGVKDVEGIVSCGSGDRAWLGSEGGCGALHVTETNISRQRERLLDGERTHWSKAWEWAKE